jgi:two-component system chemotaxis response regulator CheY
MSKLNDVLVLDYLVESREELAAVEKELLAIESEGDNLDEERINRICVAMHSVKGGSLLFDLVKIGELAQKIENAAAKIRFQHIAPTQDRLSMLLRAIDRLKRVDSEPRLKQRGRHQRTHCRASHARCEPSASFEKGGATEDKPANGTRDRLRILIAEDDLACRLLLQTFLARYGECHVALNGREAVEAFRTAFARGSSYDLICMDVMMPEMDGREAVRQLRAWEEGQGIRPPYGATIFMTTTVREVTDVFRCFRELCDAYLLKPVDLGQLLNMMKFFELVKCRIHRRVPGFSIS